MHHRRPTLPSPPPLWPRELPIASHPRHRGRNARHLGACLVSNPATAAAATATSLCPSSIVYPARRRSCRSCTSPTLPPPTPPLPLLFPSVSRSIPCPHFSSCCSSPPFRWISIPSPPPLRLTVALPPQHVSPHPRPPHLTPSLGGYLFHLRPCSLWRSPRILRGRSRSVSIGIDWRSRRLPFQRATHSASPCIMF
jgi:hypothetical protein